MATEISEVTTAKIKYPWPKWTNGKAWRVVQGIDFGLTERLGPIGFVRTLRSAGIRFGKRVKTSIKGNAVEFQFFKVTAKKRKAKGR